MSIQTQHGPPSKDGAFSPAKAGPAAKPGARQREDTQDSVEADAGTEQYVQSLDGSGKALDAATRQYFEPRFQHDFSKVSVHSDTKAARSAKHLGALAYTTGNHIVFNDGQYAPGTLSGNKLLAHELAHVVQQSHDIRPKRIQRATVSVNNQQVNIDYGNIIRITDYLAGVQSEISAFTGAPPSPATISTLTGLPVSKQRWLLFALDVLIDNTNAAFAGLNRADAVNRLIAFAPGATTEPLGGMNNTRAFTREIMLNSGWTEVAVARGLTAPGAGVHHDVQDIVNPPATGGGAPGALNAAILNTRLDRGLRALLQRLDPAQITNVGTQSMGEIQTIGDIIMSEARVFFQPYSDAARESVFNVQPAWAASSGISATTAIVPDRDRRIGYLLNRAQIVGRNSTASAGLPDTDIFADANFDGSRPADQAALNTIISAIEADPTFQGIVNRLIQHTGFQTGGGNASRIGINPEYNADTTSECRARWRTIGTLCHEVLHALAHPNFRNAATRIAFSQVTREGFTEVLGEQLYNQHVVPKAASDAAFKARLEHGLSVPSCPAPPAGIIGYASAGAGAESIRTKVGDNNFRAAYFLGRTDLVSI